MWHLIEVFLPLVIQMSIFHANKAILILRVREGERARETMTLQRQLSIKPPHLSWEEQTSVSHRLPVSPARSSALPRSGVVCCTDHAWLISISLGLDRLGATLHTSPYLIRLLHVSHIWYGSAIPLKGGPSLLYHVFILVLSSD
jgi:hypothetical protein